MARVVSIGEIMIQLNPSSTGPLRETRFFERYVAGSEANTLVGLERLGVKTSLISRVGADEFGEAILSELRASGMDTSSIKIDSDAPNGIYFVQRGYPIPSKTTVMYYRKGSAASRLCKDDIDPEWLRGADLLHLTGITPALSDSCYQACLRLVDLANELNVPISFDTNIRINLWKDRAGVIKGLIPFLSAARYVFTGTGDLRFLHPTGGFEEKRIYFQSLCPRANMVIVKEGASGATVFTSDGMRLSKPGYKVAVVDELGAGDAFDAAFLAAMLNKSETENALELANAAGALTVTAKGDIEPLPTWRDLEMFIGSYTEGDTALLR